MHSIAVDSAGNIYYSDEINHSVVCLGADGALRWNKSKHGAACGEFDYPRGLSLGRIQLQGEAAQCLAVADAWNRRVQFMDFGGNFLAEWIRAGETAFDEIVDVRFLPDCAEAGPGEASAGCWCILDRGNHCLFKMGMDGGMIDRIGEFFPSNMKNRWAVPEAFFNDAIPLWKTFENSPPLNFACYPDRILGRTQDSLFITDNDSRNLKQVFPPHLIPLRIDKSNAVQWIAADSCCLLGWNASEGWLIQHGHAAGGRSETKIAGTPIPSNLSSNEFWVQTNDGRIERQAWDFNADKNETLIHERHLWVLQAASEELKSLDMIQVQKSVEGCLNHLDEEIHLADAILAVGEADLDPRFMDGMSWHAHGFMVKCTWLSVVVREALHGWSLGELERHIAGIREAASFDTIPDFEATKNAFAKEIRGRMSVIQDRVNHLKSRMSNPLQKDPENSPPHDSWTKTASIAASNLEFAQKWIAGWSGHKISETGQ